MQILADPKSNQLDEKEISTVAIFRLGNWLGDHYQNCYVLILGSQTGLSSEISF